MYTILINKDNTLTTSVRKTITHRSTGVDTLRILVDPEYTFDDNVTLNMSNFICTMEYVVPNTRRYTPIVLTPLAELYKNKLDYRFPIDLNFTREHGNVEVKFIFTRPELQPDGKVTSRSRKTLSTTVTIVPVEAWSDYIPEADLDNITQIMLANQATAQQIETLANIITLTKADNIAKDEETNEIYLTAMGQEIGNRVKDDDCASEGGIPIVKLNGTTDNPDVKPEDKPTDKPDTPVQGEEGYRVVLF